MIELALRSGLRRSRSSPREKLRRVVSEAFFGLSRITDPSTADLEILIDARARADLRPGGIDLWSGDRRETGTSPGAGSN